MKSISSSVIALSGVILFTGANTAGYYEWHVRWAAMLLIAVGFVAWMAAMRSDSK